MGRRDFKKKSANGLFYLDGKEATGTVLVNTVEDNKSRYTNMEYSQATLARKLQNIIGRPSARTFLKIVEMNQLKDCPILRGDVLAADGIFGPNVGSLKGKTVGQGGIHVNPEYHQIPMTIMEKYRELTLCVHMMFINKLAFLVTISRGIKFGTVQFIKSRKLKELLKAIKAVKRIYALHGFKVTRAHVDNEFEPMRGDLQELGMALNVVSADEHVPEIERYTITVRERTTCIYNTVPFKQMPNTMVIEMVRSSVFWLNMFPPTDGASDSLSPTALIVGLKLDYGKHCQLEFGSYVQTHEEHDNSMGTRTTGAIALRPTGNAQGGYYFLSLSSGRLLTRNRWTDLPMPQHVIDRMHVLARRSKADRDLTFAWRDGTIITDDDDDDNDSDWGPDSEDEDSDWEPDSDNESVSSVDDDDNDAEHHIDDNDLPLAGVDDAYDNAETENENENENKNKIENET
jgi:hypothetical protein